MKINKPIQLLFRLWIITVLLVLSFNAYADNTFEVTESSMIFDHKVHETEDYSCNDCHYAKANSCVDCHDFEEGHADLDLSVSMEQVAQKKSCMKCHASEPYNAFYKTITGPFLWFSLLVFFIGLMVRSVLYIKGLDSNIDRVTYGVNTSYGVKSAIKSVFYWLVPFGTRSWRTHPVMTILFFVFHVCLIVAPVFLVSHNLILQERWGFSLITIPDTAADIMTIILLAAMAGLVVRRLILKEVRIITKASDYVVLAITVAPFITGFIAYHGISDYSFWLMAHIITGEIMLIAVPFTKLSHCFLFFFSRAQLGMDYGIKRGGMKGKGKAW